jgi:hypothetical protein
MGAASVTLYATWSVIRATGPAGGLVFYDKGDYSDGWRYLEAAPTDQATQVRWYNGVNTSTGATSYIWKFGDNQTSPAASPQHSYATPGTYTVWLIAYNTAPGGLVT